MKHLLTLLLTALITVSMFSSCSKDSSYKKKNFNSLVNNVAKNIDSLDSSKALLVDSSFMEIFNHSTSYFDDAMRLLKSQNVIGDKIVVCAYAMQTLDLDHYLKLCRLYARFYNNNKISDYTVERLIGGFVDKRIMVQNCKNPDVIAILNTFRNSKRATKELKEFVQYILDGKAA